MAKLNYKLATSEEDFFHVLRLRYEAYYCGKNKTKFDIEESTTLWKGVRVTKKLPEDDYSLIYLFLDGDQPFGTIRITRHKNAIESASIAESYPDLTNQEKYREGGFAEVTQTAIKEEYRGGSVLLYLIYYLSYKTLIENNIRFMFMEGPLKLSKVYNKYIPADLVFPNPRYYPSNSLPIYLLSYDIGQKSTFRRTRCTLTYFLIKKLWRLSVWESMRPFLFPTIIIIRSFLGIYSTPGDFATPETPQHFPNKGVSH